MKKILSTLLSSLLVLAGWVQPSSAAPQKISQTFSPTCLTEKIQRGQSCAVTVTFSPSLPKRTLSIEGKMGSSTWKLLETKSNVTGKAKFTIDDGCTYSCPGLFQFRVSVAAAPGNPKKVLPSFKITFVEPTPVLMTFRSTPIPTISLDANGTTLTGNPGVWDSGANLEYQWFESGSPLAGQTGRTLNLTKAISGDPLTFSVTASKPGYKSVTKVSSASRYTLYPTSNSAKMSVTSSLAWYCTSAPAFSKQAANWRIIQAIAPYLVQTITNSGPITLTVTLADRESRLSTVSALDALTREALAAWGCPVSMKVLIVD